jgi:hypothetical protein
MKPDRQPISSSLRSRLGGRPKSLSLHSHRDRRRSVRGHLSGGLRCLRRDDCSVIPSLRGWLGLASESFASSGSLPGLRSCQGKQQSDAPGRSMVCVRPQRALLRIHVNISTPTFATPWRSGTRPPSIRSRPKPTSCARGCRPFPLLFSQSVAAADRHLARVLERGADRNHISSAAELRP